VSVPRIVLLHGWGLTPRVWSAVRAALPADLPVSALALPGHDADAPDAGSGLAAWSDALAPAIPENCLLCGWSLGGLVALDLARRHPTRVARLVLVDTSPCFVSSTGEPPWPHGLDAATVEGFMDGFAHDPAATLRRFIALQAMGDARRRAVSGGLAEALATVAPARQAALAEGLRILADTDLRAGLPGVAQPVALAHGTGDALMPVAGARRLAETLPNATLTVYDDCGHAPLLSRPVEIAALVEAAARA